MTSPRTNPTEQEATARVAREVARQGTAIGLHIKQHDEMDASALERADKIIAEAKQQMEDAYQKAMGERQTVEQIIEKTLGEFRETATTIGERAERHLAALKQTDEQRATDHQQRVDHLENLGKSLANELQTRFGEAKSQSHEAFQQAMGEAVQKLNEEQERNSERTVTSINRAWSRLSRINMAAAAIASALAIAAIVVSLV